MIYKDFSENRDKTGTKQAFKRPKVGTRGHLRATVSLARLLCCKKPSFFVIRETPKTGRQAAPGLAMPRAGGAVKTGPFRPGARRGLDCAPRPGGTVGREGCGMATAGPWRACAALGCGWVRAEGYGAVRAQKRPPHGWPLWFGLRVRRRGPALRWQRRPGGWLLCRSSADPVLCR